MIGKKEKTLKCPECGLVFDHDRDYRHCSNCFACTGCEIFRCPGCDSEVILKARANP